MAQQKLPPEVQQTIAQYQAIRDSYLKIDAELRAIEAELADINTILDTLSTMSNDVEVYKMIGHVLIRKSKENVVKELEERRELLNIKRDKYKRQLSILEKQLKDLESKLREILSKYGISIG
ncbi:MAG: prefoldin subunit beta [Desulfurococcaceae archaeon]|uniref:Prefoldin subunit beta n=1 Tax=Staphylothermus marinus TaxID=2280 RepID=A0A7C4D709_STAMA